MKKTQRDHTVENIEADIVANVQDSLARAAFKVDDLDMYQVSGHSDTVLNLRYYRQATAMAIRDELLQKWNDTQTYHTMKAPKRVYYLSLEFLQGKS